MKRKMLTLTILCSWIGVVAVPASGQAGVRVRVPFDFVVADRTLPQGEYLFWWNTDKVVVENSQGNMVALVFSTAVSEGSVVKTGQAVFQCYERLCFLSQVWSPTRTSGRQLRKCHWEDVVARKEPPKYFALAGRDP